MQKTLLLCLFFIYALTTYSQSPASNILTPNGDGVNDKWVVRNISNYPDNSVKIYDRTGRLVYMKKSYQNDWEGTMNGHPLAEGTYYYLLELGPGQAAIKGYITIIRDLH